ncbi:hypothetical protein Ddye_006763 [Dipteronia dyeriana]|uniref:C2 domain-containing protein n=1 Tax=Dipteronia dyeriana TaxID=168575 RepID=A0AAD9XJ31_9ROSI|nr:hypothetical protein Ddye_006763 [Dipteronia dyeriana]
MSISGIHGLPLEVTVVGCYNLEDKEWISRQDPYICIEYGSNKFTTKTCTDGGRNPTFQERFVFTLIEGLRELNVGVWNSRTIKSDELIGSGKIQLHKVLTQGFDDAVWPLQSKIGRHSGEIRLILHFSSSNAISKCIVAQAPAPEQQQSCKTKVAPSAPQYATPSGALTQLVPHAPTAYNAPIQYTSYPPQPTTNQPSTYPPTPPAAYPPQTTPPAAYPPQTAGYPPQTYPPCPAGYPPQAYPPAGYPPQSYPPAPHAPTYSTYPPAGPPGSYPPPPYY